MEQKEIKQLTAEQIRSLVSKAQNRNGQEKKSGGLIERNAEQLYPVSKAQERLWFLTRLSEDLPLYNNPLSIRVTVDEELDLETLKMAWCDIADRHDIMRTTFHFINDQVMQHIHHSCDVPVTLSDLRKVPNDEREELVLNMAKEHGNILFDITQLPLVQLHVLRVSDKEYVYLINAHHLITDGWTNSMMAMELPALYEARRNMVKPNLPVIQKQFIDYVQFEQDWLKTPDFANQMNFWKELFKEIPPPIAHLADFPGGSGTTSYKGGRQLVRLPGGQKQNILAFCKQNSITPFQYMLNAYAILIHRYSGQNDFVIGIPVANRNNIHYQYTFGPFINTLPIPFHFSAGQNLNEFMANSGSTIQQALKNQSVPFASLVEELNPPRDMHSNPLFQVHFAFHSFPQLSQEGALKFVHVDVDFEVSKFDLNLWIEDDGDDWLISITYLSGLFKDISVKRLLNYYVSICCAAPAQMETAIDRLDFIPQNDQSITAAAPLDEKYLKRHWLRSFEIACEKYSSHRAVTDKNNTLTYNELNAKSGNWSAYLAANGIGPGDLVGVCLERGIDMVVSMLSLFKLGAAYLPIEPATPPDRLAFMLKDAGINYAICSSATASLLPDDINIFLTGDLESDSSDFASLPCDSYDPEMLAYVIYTSGTTGMPKGVKIAHKNLVNYTESILDLLHLAPGDSYANISTFAADLGNTSVFPPLICGGNCLIVPEESVTDTWLLADFFREHPYDFIKIVPSHLLALLDSPRASEILPAKLLMVAGETCPSALVGKIHELSPGLRMMNCYGPTESTISSLAFEIPADWPGEHSLNSVPIGFPLANTSVYLMDDHLKPVAKGSVGEICLGGTDISMGYINRAEEEKARFLPNLVMGSGRMYRTGDYGRILPGGEILFEGRKDRQVKIRGYRIELNEIESTLCRCTGVRQAVVLSPSRIHGNEGLTVVLSLYENADIKVAWADAARKLRSPMLPDKYIVVDKIPLNSNGKADFSKLKDMEAPQPGIVRVAAPRDYLELELLAIWEKVLDINDLSIEDSFFDVGGHSLLAVRLLSRINEQFGIRFPLSILFENNDVKQLAGVLRSREVHFPSKPVIKFHPGHLENKMIFLHPAGGNVMCYYPIANAIRNQWQVIAIQSAGYHLNDGTGIPELSKYYLDEILEECTSADNVIFAGWSMGALLAQHMACLFKEITGKRSGLIIIDQPAPSNPLPGSFSFPDLADRLVVFADKVSHLIGVDLGIKKEMIDGLDEQKRSLLFMNKFRDVGILPADMQLSEFHGYLDLMLQHNEISMDFHPGTFTGPALVIKAGERLSIKGLSQSESYFKDDLGWAPWLSDLTSEIVPGNHVTIINADHVEHLSRAILSWCEAKREELSL